MKNRFAFGDSVERWSPTLALVGGAFFVVAALAWLLGGSPEGPRYLPLVQLGLAGGAICLLAALAIRPSLWMNWIGIRQVRYGTNALIMIAAFLAIIVLINYVAKQPRFSKQWDLTEEQELTLSQPTVDLVNGLSAPVQVVGFYAPAQRGQQESAETLLKRYQAVNGEKLTYKFYDPQTTEGYPVAVAFGLTQADIGSLYAVDTAANRREKITGTDEQAISSGIYRLTHPTKRVVYFLQGHGELGAESFTNASSALDQLNYSVKSTVITATTLPTDTSVLVVAGPLADFKQNEVDAISAFVGQGGALALFVDPDEVMAASQTNQGLEPHPFGGPLQDYLRATWGITLSHDLVLDQQSSPQVPMLAPVVIDYPPHAITQRLRLPTVLVFARSLQLTPAAPGGASVQPLLQSSAQSWGETNIQSLNSPSGPTFDEGQDLSGPVDMALAGTLGDGHLLLVGSTSLIDDRFAISDTSGATGNRAFWVAAINWLVGEDTSFTVPKAPPAERSVVATAAVTTYVGLSSVCLIPGVIMIAGIVVFFQRRRQV